MTTYNVSNLDSNASVVTITSQGPQGADAVLQAGNRGDFTVAIAGNGSQTATINTGAVTSDKILDGTILNADINASAGILGTKISPNFGSQNITTTGNIAGAGGTFSNDLSIINTIPTINLTNTISDSDYRIQNYSGTFTIKDVTNGSNRLTITSDGTANFSGNLDVGAGLDITGDITATNRVTCSSITISDGQPGLIFEDTGANPDFILQNRNGTFAIRDTTNNVNRFLVNAANGDITVTGTVDGVDIAALNTSFSNLNTAVSGLSSGSAVLTNGVTATTQSAGDNSAKVATTAYTDTAISNLVDSSPAALNTLNELAAALGDDANFSTTVTNSIATKLSLSGGTINGNVTLNDGKELFFGTDNDFKIKHSGSLADIVNSTGNLRLETGTGNNILFRTDDNDGTHTNIIVCDGTTGSEHVDLYHSNSRRLATESDGVRIVGKLKTGFEGDLPSINPVTRAVFSGSFDNTDSSQNTSSAISILCKGGANSRINFGNHTNEDQAQIKFRNAFTDLQFLIYDSIANELRTQLEIGSDSIELNYAGSKKAETSLTGFDVSGELLVKSTAPKINFIDTNNANRFRLDAGGGTLQLQISSNNGVSFSNAIGIGSGAIELHHSGTKKAETSSAGFDISGFLNTTHSTNGYSIFKTENAGSGLKIASKTASSVARLVFSNNHSGTLANNWFIEAGFISSNYYFTVGKGDIDDPSGTATPMLQISDAVLLNYADTVNGTFSTKAQTTSTGFNVIGTNIKLRNVANGDLIKLFHSGTGGNALITSEIGNVKIQPNENGGQVQLFETTSGTTTKRLSTTNNGIDVNGDIRGSSGILFNNDTADANTLDDYEEGTWTPTVLSEGNIGTPQITCTYTKIGRLVTINADIHQLSDTTSSTFIKIGGLPFVPSGTVSNEHSGVCHGERYGGSDIIVAYIIYNSGSYGISFRFGVPTNHFSGVRHSHISDNGEDNNLRFTLTYEIT